MQCSVHLLCRLVTKLPISILLYRAYAEIDGGVFLLSLLTLPFLSFFSPFLPFPFPIPLPYPFTSLYLPSSSPTPFFSFLSLPLPFEVGPLNQLWAWGSTVSSPAGFGRNLVHSRAVRKPLVAIVLSILKCMFYSRSIKM